MKLCFLLQAKQRSNFLKNVTLNIFAQNQALFKVDYPIVAQQWFILDQHSQMSFTFPCVTVIYVSFNRVHFLCLEVSLVGTDGQWNNWTYACVHEVIIFYSDTCFVFIQILLLLPLSLQTTDGDKVFFIPCQFVIFFSLKKKKVPKNVAAWTVLCMCWSQISNKFTFLCCWLKCLYYINVS